MSDAGAMASWDTSVAAALASWLILIAPQWIMLLWGIRSLDRIRAAADRSAAVKLLAVCTWMAALALAVVGSVMAVGHILGAERLAFQRLMDDVTLAQEGVLIAIGLLLVRRRQRLTGKPLPGPKSPSAMQVRKLTWGWIGAAFLLLGLAIGPFRGRPAVAFVWGALALAGIAILGLLTISSLARRRDQNKAAATKS